MKFKKNTTVYIYNLMEEEIYEGKVIGNFSKSSRIELFYIVNKRIYTL